MNHFPTYQPSEERMAEIAKTYAEENNPLGQHYDASKEVRAKGAGFYQFSGDEATRAAQMEELKASREETTKIRQELGAEDVKFGEVEGMRHGEGHGSTGGVVVGRGVEKRKRELEERRKLLEAKRKKMKASNPSAATSQSIATPETPKSLQSPKKVPSISSPPVSSAGASKSSGSTSANKPVHISEDPFSSLEAVSPSKGKGKHKALSPSEEADSFLARLEHEFLGADIKK